LTVRSALALASTLPSGIFGSSNSHASVVVWTIVLVMVFVTVLRIFSS